MGLITNMEDVRKKIGEERAERVRIFRDLVNNRKYTEAKRLLEQYEGNNEAMQDLRDYAGIYLKELSCRSMWYI